MAGWISRTRKTHDVVLCCLFSLVMPGSGRTQCICVSLQNRWVWKCIYIVTVIQGNIFEPSSPVSHMTANHPTPLLWSSSYFRVGLYGIKIRQCDRANVITSLILDFQVPSVPGINLVDYYNDTNNETQRGIFTLQRLQLRRYPLDLTDFGWLLP